MRPIAKDKRYTVRDYRSWDDDGRYELIDGEVFDMAPAPNPSHQSLTMKISTQLDVFLERKPCRVFAVPFDVYPFGDKDGDTVVQPDVFVVCGRAKITNRGVTGAPDIVVEVLSPYTSMRNSSKKFRLYQRAGVPEYWLVSPDERAVFRYILVDGQYEETEYTSGETPSVVLPDFKLDVDAMFGSLIGLVEDE